MELRFQPPFADRLTKFDIYVNGVNSYYAESKQIVLTYTIGLYINEGGDNISLRLTVKKIPSLRPHYHIKLLNKEVLTFKTVSFWGGHYQCETGDSIYDIYYWRNGKYTIHKNGAQIAYAALPISVADNMLAESGHVLVDNDCDVELIMAFTLIIYRCTSNAIASLIYNGVGRIKPFETEFNSGWKPK